ncbi:Fh51 [Fasciola gigantica]|uniref:Fh51 n=1 Tax=Fasciola gigantica TaxID=46835 RepID=A0A504Z0W5_FASGI|nr:Fh51 [Fasciola gigantica]
MVYEALDCIRYLAPQCLDAFPKLREFKKRIELQQPVRLLLEYLGEEYEEHLYGRDDREKWLGDKFNMGLDLPNDLPKIKAYMESKKFIKWPLNSWTASFGGGDAAPA